MVDFDEENNNEDEGNFPDVTPLVNKDDEYASYINDETSNDKKQNNVKLKDKRFEILYSIKNKLDEEIEEFILDQNIMHLQIKELKQIHKNILKVLNIKSLDDSKYFKFKNLRKFREKNLYQRNIQILWEIKNRLELLEFEKKDEDKVEYAKEKDNTVKQIQSAMLMLNKEQQALANNFSQLQEDLKKQNNSDTDTDVKLLREELDELQRKEPVIKEVEKKELVEVSKEDDLKKIEKLEQQLQLVRDLRKADKKQIQELENKEPEVKFVKKEEKKPKSGNKIVKYMLYGLGGFLGLIVLWFVYAFAFAPAKDNSLSAAVQKVKPQQKTKNKQVKKEEKKPYDFTKKLTEKEFKKQKFDIYPNNEFACRVNGKRFEANDIINGWMFRKTVPSWKKLIFTDPAETKSFSVDMVDE